MAEVEVRRAREEDLAVVAGIVNWAIEHTSANFHTSPEGAEAWLLRWRDAQERHPWLVAELGAAVRGFAYATTYKGRAAYDWTAEVSVYVDPAHHRRGIGKALYGVLIPVLERQGYRALIASITRPNEPSERLHAAFGFEHLATLRRVGWKLDRWHDVGLWQRSREEETPPVPLRSVSEAWTRG
jgi:phosphinothricin acetyltransferase